MGYYADLIKEKQERQNSKEEKENANYYAKLVEEKRNGENGPRFFKVLNETFDVSSAAEFKKASDLINKHHREVMEKAERDYEKAMSEYERTKSDIDKWQAEIGNRLMKEARVR